MRKEEYKHDIINEIISKNGYEEYLEIGVDDGYNFNRINCKHKTGVDPKPYKPVLEHRFERMTSDAFFAINKQKYDIVFIDGLHEHEQVIRDIQNSLSILNPNGMIICHDLIPTSKPAQEIPRRVKIWTGDCWRAWIYFRANYAKLSMYVIDMDYGLGIIQRGKQEPIIADYKTMTYEGFKDNIDRLLNLKPKYQG